jgi:UDP-N-acetylmuramoyl-tripeptide--D-alanyl-D-alanine ligase
LIVPDTRKAMGHLARRVRRDLTAAVIAVAGSNGKTGTKRLIDAALHTQLSGSISPKSFNNDIGVPVTIFAADPQDDYLVLEIGTNHHGEIAWLAEISQPDIAVITNCSAEHLEGLTDLDGVRRENAAITRGMSAEGLLVVNGDDPLLLQAVSAFDGRRVSFGFSPGNDLWAADVICRPDGTRFKLNGRADVFVPLLGRHSAANALAAIAVGRELGVADDRLIAGLATATGPEMRLQLKLIGGISLLNDAYNANPASVRAALETLCALPARGRRIAVLGEMRELGDWAEKYHREIGAFAAQCKLDALVCVGRDAAWIAQAAQEAGMEHDCITCYPDAISAAAGMVRWLSSGDLILLKASRAIGLERIATEIAQVMGASVRAAG